MNRIKTIWHMGWGQMRKLLYKPRFYIALLWFVFLNAPYMSKVRNFVDLSGVAVSPWIFPFLTTENTAQIFIMIGAVLIFCDAPFLNENVYIQMIRCGRKKWFWGSMVYIGLAALFYAVSLFVIPILMLLPKVQFMTGWGKVLGTLAQTNAASMVSLKQLNYSIIANFTPLQAVGLTLFAVWLNTVLIGVVCYGLSLHLKNGSGAIGGTVIALSPLLLRMLVQLDLAPYLAPPVWMDITMYSWKGREQYPSPAYIYSFLVGAIVFFIVLSYVGIRRKDIYAVKEI